MVEFAQYGELPNNSFDIIALNDPSLLEDLDGYAFTRGSVHPFLDEPKSTLTYGCFQLKIADSFAHSNRQAEII